VTGGEEERVSAVTRIIRAVYGARAAPAPPRAGLVRPAGARPRRRAPLLDRLAILYRERPGHVWRALGLLLALALLVVTILYYNRLVGDHDDALAARAKVEALLQRRADLARSLEQAVLAHARHETAVYRDVTGRRVELAGGAPASAPATAAPVLPDLAGLPLSKLLAIAEQYPQVRLGENLQAVIAALVEVERDLDTMRRQFVDAANRYAHHLDTFPGNLFGHLFGFQEIPFFEADPHARQFAPVTFEPQPRPPLAPRPRR
jgi:LemA protein